MYFVFMFASYESDAAPSPFASTPVVYMVSHSTFSMCVRCGVWDVDVPSRPIRLSVCLAGSAGWTILFFFSFPCNLIAFYREPHVSFLPFPF